MNYSIWDIHVYILPLSFGVNANESSNKQVFQEVRSFLQLCWVSYLVVEVYCLHSLISMVFVYTKRHHPLLLLMFQVAWLFSLVLSYVALNTLYWPGLSNFWRSCVSAARQTAVSCLIHLSLSNNQTARELGRLTFWPLACFVFFPWLQLPTDFRGHSAFS